MRPSYDQPPRLDRLPVAIPLVTWSGTGMHGPQQSSAEKLAEARSRAVDALLVKHGIRPRRKRAKRTQPPSNIEREVGVDVGIVRRTFGSVLRVS